MSTKESFGRTILSYIEIVVFAFILSWGLRSAVVQGEYGKAQAFTGQFSITR